MTKLKHQINVLKQVPTNLRLVLALYFAVTDTQINSHEVTNMALMLINLYRADGVDGPEEMERN